MFTLCVFDAANVGFLLSFASFAAACFFLGRARRLGWRVSLRNWR